MPEDVPDVAVSEDLLALLDPDEREVVAGSPASAPDLTESLGMVADSAFVRRVTVLAHSSPLHAMETRESWQGFAPSRYDLRSLALAALDAVILRQGLAEEATADEVIAMLSRLAELAAPDLDASDHVEVARFVLRELLNDREAGAMFVVHYSDYREGHRRLPLPFSLLKEAVGRRGQVVLRASTEAINALVGGLELEVEDAQLAMDAVLRAQIDRGQWGRAEESATKSMLLSVALAEQVRKLLAETERDVGSVDWADSVPTLLKQARGHLEERLRVEDGLMERMREARNDAGAPDVRGTCQRILDLLDHCHTRHTDLHGQVLRAARTFLDAQAGQRFRPPARRRLVALGDELLRPMLRMGAAEACVVGDAFAEAVAGPVAQRLPKFAELYKLLLAPTREPGKPIPEEAQPDIPGNGDDVDAPYHERERDATRSIILTARKGPRRLSELLAEAEPAGPVVVDLVAMSVLWAYAPEHDDSDDPPMEFDDLFATTLVVLDDGADLQHPRYSGNDLLVVPAEPSKPPTTEVAGAAR